MLKKIISGGQTGADQAGLIAGHRLGLETGGTAPYNWMTENGQERALLEGFGLVAGPPDPKTYPKRTRMNVQGSDATVIFRADGSNSPGTKLTIDLCIRWEKPFFINPDAKYLAKLVKSHKVETLNVAGNRESRFPGITENATKLLMEAFGKRDKYAPALLREIYSRHGRSSPSFEKYLSSAPECIRLHVEELERALQKRENIENGV